MDNAKKFIFWLSRCGLLEDFNFPGFRSVDYSGKFISWASRCGELQKTNFTFLAGLSLRAIEPCAHLVATFSISTTTYNHILLLLPILGNPIKHTDFEVEVGRPPHRIGQFFRYLSTMKIALKEHLIKKADKLTAESTLEDVYEHLSMLSDIEESEQQEKSGEILSQLDVEQNSRAWLK